jgi:hypothetical protein
MAIIDLRHLVEPSYDTVKIIGAKDGKEYSLPTKTTVKTTLYSQHEMSKILSLKDKMSEVEYNLEAGYVHIFAWIKSYYEEIDLQWVKDNITDERIMSKLISCAMQIFYPGPSKKPETGKPKRPRKKRLS